MQSEIDMDKQLKPLVDPLGVGPVLVVFGPMKFKVCPENKEKGANNTEEVKNQSEECSSALCPKNGDSNLVSEVLKTDYSI